MDDDDFYQPIPEIFHSFEHDGPFQHCQMCRADLVQQRLIYAIEKVYRGEEVMLEHAICMDCMREMEASYSVKSREAMHEYQTQFNLEISRERYEETGELESCLDRCVAKGHARSAIRDYHIVALCHGPEVLTFQPPFMISGEAIEEMQELLSAETRGEIDRYMRDHLNTFPDLDKILGGPRPLLV